MFKAILSSFGLVGLVVAILVAIVLLPFLSIWAFNVLFPALLIPYTLETWAATILVGAFFRSSK